MDPIEHEEEPLELVMPFQVVTSAGGPLDDRAFIAGVEFGRHNAELSTCAGAQSWLAYVIPEMVPQYDLLAMHHGFVMVNVPWDEHPDDWSLVVFTRPEVSDAD